MDIRAYNLVIVGWKWTLFSLFYMNWTLSTVTVFLNCHNFFEAVVWCLFTIELKLVTSLNLSIWWEFCYLYIFKHVEMYSSVGFGEFHLTYDENSPLQPHNTEVARCFNNHTSFIRWAKCRQVVIHDTYEANDIYPKPYCVLIVIIEWIRLPRFSTISGK